MAEGDTPNGPPGGAPPGGGGEGPSASYSTATVGIARVGRVEILDPRTGQPRDSANDLIEQIRALGDRLDTSLGAMLAEMKNFNRGATDAAGDTGDHERRAERTDKTQTESLRQMERSSEVMSDLAAQIAKVLENNQKTQTADNKELLDATQQGFASIQKGPMSGLKHYIDAHKTMLRKFIEDMRSNASNDLKKLSEAYRSRHMNEDIRVQMGQHGGAWGPYKPTPETTRKLERLDVPTYLKQRATEEMYSNAERLALHLDKAVASLYSFTNTTDYASKKWKQYIDVAGSGVDNFWEFISSDFAKLHRDGDALGETFEFLRKSVKAGIATNDSQLFIASRSLQQASVELQNLRRGTREAGFNTRAFMGFRDENEVLGEMLTQMKRAGILDQMNDSQRNHYLAEQLKQAQLTAENTSLTVKEVMKMNAEASKKIAILNAGGMIADQNKGLWDAAKSRFAATNPEMMNRLLEMQGSGGFEQWASKNQDAYRSMRASGTDDAFRQALDILNSGTDDLAGATKTIEQMMLATARESHARTQQQGQHVMGALVGPQGASLLADLNQVAPFGKKNEPGEGSTIMSGVNRMAEFFANSFVWDAFKALAGIPMGLASANVLLFRIAMNTGGLGSLGGLLKGGGKLLGKGAGAIGRFGGAALGGIADFLGMGATIAGTTGATTAAAGAATAGAGAVGGGLLGGLLKGGGKMLLRGIPLVGGLIGGAADKATGGSLLGAMLSGGAIGGATGLIAGGGVLSVPGAIIGALGGAITGAIGYGLADWFGAGDQTTTSADQQGPNPASYTSRDSNQMAELGKGMFERMDIQIEKLVELITVVKESNKAIVMNANMVRQTAGMTSGSVNDGGSFLGTISKLWG